MRLRVERPSGGRKGGNVVVGERGLVCSEGVPASEKVLLGQEVLGPAGTQRGVMWFEFLPNDSKMLSDTRAGDVLRLYIKSGKAARGPKGKRQDSTGGSISVHGCVVAVRYREGSVRNPIDPAGDAGNKDRSGWAGVDTAGGDPFGINFLQVGARVRGSVLLIAESVS